MSNITLTQELVKSLFDYHIEGFLIWKVQRAPQLPIGTRAGCLKTSDNKYRVLIDGKSYLVHRVIFLFHKGYLPKVIDHKDRITTNNRIENLREATFSENCKNRASFKNSTSKYLGVCFRKDNKKWAASIQDDGKKMHLGFYNTENEAALVYNKAAEKYHGEFANLNTITIWPVFAKSKE